MVSSFKPKEECGSASTALGDSALGWGVPENSIREWIIKLFHEGGSSSSHAYYAGFAPMLQLMLFKPLRSGRFTLVLLEVV